MHYAGSTTVSVIEKNAIPDFQVHPILHNTMIISPPILLIIHFYVYVCIYIRMLIVSAGHSTGVAGGLESAPAHLAAGQQASQGTHVYMYIYVISSH